MLTTFMQVLPVLMPDLAAVLVKQMPPSPATLQQKKRHYEIEPLCSTGSIFAFSLTLKPPSTSKLLQQDKTTTWTEQNIPIVLPDKNRGDALLCSCSLGPRRHTQCSGGRVVGILLTSRPNWIIFLAFFLRRGMDRQRALYAKQARVSTSLRVPVLSIYFFHTLLYFWSIF